MLPFSIVRRSKNDRISINIPFEAKRGTFIMRDPADKTTDKEAQGKLADGMALGCLTRDVVIGGPTVVQRAQVWPIQGELPDAVNSVCSLDPLPEAFECEGTDFIVQSGTGAIDANTALNSKLSFKGGKVYVGQTNDEKLYVLSGFKTPEEPANGFRIVCERIS